MLRQHPSQNPLQNRALNGLGDKFGKALAAEHLPCAADGIRGQRDHRQVLIDAVLELTDHFQGLYPVKSRHHMIQEDDVVGNTVALRHRLSTAQTGVHINSIASQHALSHHQVHLLIVHRQRPHTRAGERFPSRGLGLREAARTQLSVQQVRNGEGRKRFMYHKQFALAVQIKLLFRDHNDPESVRHFFIICRVLNIFRLSNKNMGQMMAVLQLQQSLEVVGLISLDAKPFHQIQNQTVVILPNLVTAVPIRSEIAGDTQLLRVIEHNTRLRIHHALRNRYMRVEPLLALAFKVNKAAHGVQKPPGNGKPKTEAAHKTAAS